MPESIDMYRSRADSLFRVARWIFNVDMERWKRGWTSDATVTEDM